MSTEIDWSKAPEGATHYAPGSDIWTESFMKLEDDIWYAQSGYDDKEWIVDDTGDDPSRYIPRSSPWSGEGLPPVGTVCECQRPGDIWQKVIILAHHNGHAWVTGDDGKHCFTVTAYGVFRPIKTPEQIAAEERDKAVHQMGLDAGFSGSVQQCYERLYDLGYRKVEGGHK